MFNWFIDPVTLEGGRIFIAVLAGGIAGFGLGVICGKVKQRREDEKYFWWKRPLQR